MTSNIIPNVTTVLVAASSTKSCTLIYCHGHCMNVATPIPTVSPSATSCATKTTL